MLNDFDAKADVAQQVKMMIYFFIGFSACVFCARSYYRASMHRTLALSLLAFLLSLFATGCATNPAQRPQLSPVAEKINTLDFAGTTLDFDLKVNNPSPRQVVVIGYKYDFLVEGKKFDGRTTKAKMKLPVGETWERTLAMDVRLGALDKHLGKEGKKKSAVRYELRGYVTVVDRSGSRKLPFRVDGQIALLRKPEFALENLRAENFAAKNADVHFDLVITNVNIFHTKFSNATVDLVLDGQTFIQEVPVNTSPLVAGATARLPMQFQVRFDLLPNARLILENKKVTYTLVGRSSFATPWGEKKIEFQRSGSAYLKPLFESAK